MPTAPKKKAVAPNEKKTKLNLQLREVLGDAYSFVLGEKFTDSMSSVTLEEMMLEQINQTSGTSGKTDIRPNKLDQLERIVTQIEKVVKTVKDLPPSYFVRDADKNGAAGGSNVNTPL